MSKQIGSTEIELREVAHATIPFCVAMAIGLQLTACTDKREGDESPGVASLTAADGGGDNEGEESGDQDSGNVGDWGDEENEGEGDDGEAGDDDDDDDDDGDDGPVEDPRFDLGSLPDHELPPEDGCAKVDFLFVIDNSGSMADEQANLLRNFPGFIKSIEDVLEVSDFHVMAVDTDASSGLGSFICLPGGNCICTLGNDCCDEACLDPDAVTCENMMCPDNPDGDVDCDRVLGAGKNTNSTNNQMCQIGGDRRYITSADTNVADAFTCAAHMGTMGDGNERPMSAMLAAIGDDLNKADGCNEGFLRDDAILVVTVITDEEDNGKSAGTPATWKQQLVAAKGGIEDAVVVLGLIGDLDLPANESICEPSNMNQMTGAEASPNLRMFFRSFNRGLDASVCADDYQPFFEDAVGIIDDACDIFDPPGR